MANIQIQTNFNIELDFVAAPFYMRFLAWLVDVIVLFVYSYLALKVVSFSEKIDENISWVLFITLAVPFFTYHLLCEVFMNGQSIGKKITRIQVINEMGGQPSLGQYIIRWLIRTSDLMVFAVLLYSLASISTGDMSFIWKIGITFCLFVADMILVNIGKQQRLGDILAHTLVITLQHKEKLEDTIFLEVDKKYIPSFPMVMNLSDRDINSIKRILDTVKKRKDDELALMAAEKVKTHLQIQTELSAIQFLETLMKDYNFLSVH